MAYPKKTSNKYLLFEEIVIVYNIMPWKVYLINF